MKTLRTAGIMLSVAASATALALLPSIEQSAEQQPGIVVGEQTGASDGGGDTAALPGDVPETPTSTGAVDLPRSSATEQPADAGADGLEYEPSRASAPSTASEPSGAARSGGSGSSEDSSGTGSTGSTGSSTSSNSPSGGDSSAAQQPASPKEPATPSAPSSTCEWDDGQWDCDDDDNSDNSDDDSSQDDGDDDDGDDG